MKPIFPKKTYQLNGEEVTQETLINTARHCIREKLTVQSDIFTDPEVVKEYIQVLIGDYEDEVFYAIWLNSQHCVIQHGILFRGTINHATIYPREVIKTGLSCNAAAVIFAHNHPSGLPEPSQGDIALTQELKTALNVIEIKLLDHFIVGKNVISMAERGLL